MKNSLEAFGSSWTPYAAYKIKLVRQDLRLLKRELTIIAVEGTANYTILLKKPVFPTVSLKTKTGRFTVSFRFSNFCFLFAKLKVFQLTALLSRYTDFYHGKILKITKFIL